MCILEAGPRDFNPLIHIPAGYIKNIYSKTLTWNFESEPGLARTIVNFPFRKAASLVAQVLLTALIMFVARR